MTTLNNILLNIVENKLLLKKNAMCLHRKNGKCYITN